MSNSSGSRGRPTLLSLIACFFLVAPQVALAGSLANGDAAAGRSLYWSGLNDKGEPVTAIAEGDVEFSGTQFSCVSCHRPSGFGSSEGGHYVPPITGPRVFNPSEADRVERFKEMFQESQPSSFWAQLREPRLRPAYDETTLARSLRDGIDPNGERLNAVMPRYDIGDRDMANLIAFIRTLSVAIDPGVDADTIHFATIVTEDVDPQAQTAMLDTMQLFFTWMNTDTEGDLQHPAFSPGYRSTFLDAYRRWELHVWTLTGAPETWPAQLESYLQKQPVFAAIGGLVNGPWTRIGDFCDRQHLPCLFPNSELPRQTDVAYGYSIYFSGGLALEAKALAIYLANLPQPPRSIKQVWRNDPYGEIPATAFATALAELLTETEIVSDSYTDDSEIEAALSTQRSGLRPEVLVLWPGRQPIPALHAITRVEPRYTLLSLPSGALEAAKNALDPDMIGRTIFTHPYELATRYHPRKFRVRAWMHSRRLEVSHPRLQYQTYYALSLVQFGLQHMLSDFHRDYFIELVEHEAENRLNPGTHPTLALGPGQRLASKGAYIIALDQDAKGGYKALSKWIVP
ncbi:MAG: hypothetical protein ACI915_002454 [Gammaproteobacteria bacterium]